MAEIPSTAVTVNDIDALVTGATPQFSQQILERVKALIAPLPDSDPARVYGEVQVAVLERMATSTTRGVMRLGVPGDEDQGWETIPSHPRGGIAPGASDGGH